GALPPDHRGGRLLAKAVVTRDAAEHPRPQAAAHAHRLRPRSLAHTSMSSASPWPPPEQIAARPSPPPLRCSSWIIVARILAPEAPIGCPSATAPPFTFTRSGSAPSISTELSATDEKASLISTRSTSPIFLPAFASAI